MEDPQTIDAHRIKIEVIGMADKITIYDLLVKSKVSETTIAQLNAATKHTAITLENVDFWSGIITVSRAIHESRTYGNALPIPELSVLETVTIGDGASGTIKPSGTEIWKVQAISLDNCIAFLTDGSGMMTVTLGGDNATIPGELYITNGVYIGFQNASGGEQTPGIAYHKVGL